MKKLLVLSLVAASSAFGYVVVDNRLACNDLCGVTSNGQQQFNYNTFSNACWCLPTGVAGKNCSTRQPQEDACTSGGGISVAAANNGGLDIATAVVPFTTYTSVAQFNAKYPKLANQVVANLWIGQNSIACQYQPGSVGYVASEPSQQGNPVCLTLESI